MTVHPAKTQISLGIRPVWSESSLCAQWVAKDPNFLHAHSEDSDQTGRMLRLILVFVGRIDHFVGFVMRRLIFELLGSFLAHLSRRFTRWAYKIGLEPASRRASVRPHFQTWISPRPAGRLQSNFICSITWVGERLHYVLVQIRSELWFP